MKVAVVSTMVPFVWGGAEELALHLTRNLNALGHQAELYRIPFAWEPFSGIPREIARSKALRLAGFDRVISLKFPAYLVESGQHSTWLVHQYRQAYDLWESSYCNIPHNREGEDVRDLIIAHDNQALGERSPLFTISQEITDRLERFNGIAAPALRAPLNDAELFTGGDYGDYIVAPGRINAAKRQTLLVEAMGHLRRGARLIVAGPPDSKEDANALRKLVAKLGLDQQVKLDLRFLSRRELAEYVNSARAVAYIPYEEDSYGYVTMEAFEAGKPVITVSDAGELLEIVKHGETGMVTAPDPQRLAEAMSRYLSDEILARDHGQAARQLWRRAGIDWPTTVARLLEQEKC